MKQKRDRVSKSSLTRRFPEQHGDVVGPFSICDHQVCMCRHNQVDSACLWQRRSPQSIYEYTPQHKTDRRQNNFIGKLVLREYMQGLYSYSHEYRKMLFRNYFQICLANSGGNDFGASTCRACIRIPANTGKYSRQIMYWFRAMGYSPATFMKLSTQGRNRFQGQCALF